MRRRGRKSGFTLIEMLISSMLFSVIAIGVTTYILYMTRFQQAQTFRKVVDDVLLNIVQNVQDDRAWTNTVAHANNPSLSCLKDRGDVADSANNGCIDEVNATDTAAEEGAQTILLMNGQVSPATPTVFYDPNDRQGLVTDPALPGFSLSGKTCNTFVDPAVNDQCPLWANIYWEPVCTAGTNACRYPLIRVKAIMKFRPFTTERRYAFGDERSRAIIYRNTIETANFFTAVVEDRRANTTVGGACVTGAFANTVTMSDETDTGNFITGVPGASLVFAAGTYDCEFFTTGFNADSFQARLQQTSGTATTHILGTTEFSGGNFPSNAQSWGYGVFTLAAAETLQLQFQCQTPRSTSDRGKPVSFGGEEIYSKLRCVKIR